MDATSALSSTCNDETWKVFSAGLYKSIWLIFCALEVQSVNQNVGILERQVTSLDSLVKGLVVNCDKCRSVNKGEVSGTSPSQWCYRFICKEVSQGQIFICGRRPRHIEASNEVGIRVMVLYSFERLDITFSRMKSKLYKRWPLSCPCIQGLS